MSQGRKSLGRRTFLAGLLTGAGVAAAVSAAPRKVAAKKEAGPAASAAAPVLYRRTKDAERYYRTLYS